MAKTALRNFFKIFLTHKVITHLTLCHNTLIIMLLIINTH